MAKSLNLSKNSSEIINGHLRPVKMKILEGYDQMFELVNGQGSYGGTGAPKVIPKKTFRDARLLGHSFKVPVEVVDENGKVSNTSFAVSIGNQAASSLMNDGSNVNFNYLYVLLVLVFILVVVLLFLLFLIHKKKQRYKLRNPGPLLLNSPNSSISSVEKGVLRSHPDSGAALSNLSWKVPQKKKQLGPINLAEGKKTADFDLIALRNEILVLETDPQYGPYDETTEFNNEGDARSVLSLESLGSLSN